MRSGVPKNVVELPSTLSVESVCRRVVDRAPEGVPRFLSCHLTAKLSPSTYPFRFGRCPFPLLPHEPDWTVVGKKSRRKMSANAFKVLQGQVETHGGPAEDGPGVTTEKVHQQLDRTVVELRAAAFVAQLKRRMSERGFGVMCPADREHPADLAGAPLPAAKKERRFEKMVILGLGSPSNSSTARLQLALALVLAEFLGLPLDVIELYDPVFSPIDGEVLKTRGMRVLTRDESDRYVGPSASPTEAPMFFFMPHCEAVLYEGLLRANWAAPESLRGHAVLGNNFETYVERWSHRMDAEVGHTH